MPRQLFRMFQPTSMWHMAFMVLPSELSWSSSRGSFMSIHKNLRVLRGGMHPWAGCGGELVRIWNLLAPRRVFKMCQSKTQSIRARSFKSFGYLQPHSVSAQDYKGTSSLFIHMFALEPCGWGILHFVSWCEFLPCPNLFVFNWFLFLFARFLGMEDRYSLYRWPTRHEVFRRKICVYFWNTFFQTHEVP